ncbi:lipopolysaccharide biosynthesis protein [Candidatus Scalindua japonica]|uniref:Lipopolysaccharide biosynthesis protein n=1 Tax=Candidatus Scalindua japonica TaxID=1284222 RepID=A0A286TZE8_9BACT|nr:GNVR domain-containing protein [Candidatus Scalindua japonica]GAX61260.1 lipopolysaccharide biosynthesis protein [Candidatus Scalindua japonica]
MQLEEHADLELVETGGKDNSLVLRNFLFVIFRNKWKVLLVFLLTSVTATLIVLSIETDIYESQAQILIKPGRENISWDESALAPNLVFAKEGGLNAEISILTSGYVLGRVIELVGQEAILPVLRDDLDSQEQRDQLAERLVLENLSVIPEKGKQQIVTISFKSHDPRIARDVLENLIDVYIDRHIDIHKAEAQPKFFRKQSDKFKSLLIEKEKQLRQYCDKQGIVSIEVQKEEGIARISGLEQNIEETDGLIISSQGRIAMLEKSLDERTEVTELSKVTGKSNPVADSLKQRLIDLKFREVELGNRYLDDSRILVELRSQISFVEAELLKEQETNTELTTGIDANYQAIQLELEQEQAKLQALLLNKQFLKKSLEKRKNNLKKLSNYEAVLLTLQREVDIAKEEYSQYRKSYQQSMISVALDSSRISNVLILQPASLPAFPIESKKKRNLAMGLLLGLVGSVGIAYIREYLDDTIKTVENVEKQLGLPVLTSINYKK